MKIRQLTSQDFKSAVIKLLGQDMPIKTALDFKNTVELINGEITKYEAARLELLKKYGKKNEDGSLTVDEHNNVQFEDADILAFAQEYNSLLDQEVAVQPFSITDLGDKVTASYEDLVNLSGLVVN